MGFLAVLFLATAVVAASAYSTTEGGMDMAVKAFEGVCWWEGLKSFPKQNIEYYGCQAQAQSMKDQVMAKLSKEKDQQKYFGTWIEQIVMSTVPSIYKQNCASFLKDPNMVPTSDESDALNDINKGPYPFQGFAYCMIKTLRDTQGQQAITDLKNEKTVSLKNWRQTILDRENEYRARHGVQPFTMSQYLNDEAQKWADTITLECKGRHSDGASRKWNGVGTGENLSSGNGKNIAEDNAYMAANRWYAEVQYYPYPGGYTGQETLKGAIGHFTQMVWKNTLYSGYGYGYNKTCGVGYVVGRYSPPGNVVGGYVQNVLPIVN